MIVKLGDKGPHVAEIKKALSATGMIHITEGNYFDQETDAAVRLFQENNGLTIDGKVGPETMAELGIHSLNPSNSGKYDEKYKNVTIKGSVFPDDPIRNDVKITLNKEIINEYLPVVDRIFIGHRTGLQLLCIIMAYKEGFRNGKNPTRAYKHNNPGNIGNKDSGKNQSFKSLLDGVVRQFSYIQDVATGDDENYPLGKRKVIKPYYSKEVAKHTKLYGISPWLPGYDFIYTGQLDQFIKIYATGPRASNKYMSMIISYFKLNGFDIGPESKIIDIVQLGVVEVVPVNPYGKTMSSYDAVVKILGPLDINDNDQPIENLDQTCEVVRRLLMDINEVSEHGSKESKKVASNF